MLVSSSLLRKHSSIFEQSATTDALSSELGTWYHKSWCEAEPLPCRLPCIGLAGSTPAVGILIQWPTCQLDFTSGNSSKENPNHFNGMGDILGEKITKLKLILTCNEKQAMGCFHGKSWMSYNGWRADNRK